MDLRKHPVLVGRFFLQYHSAMNGGMIYFAGNYAGPWARDLEGAKSYTTQARAEKAKEKLALRQSAYCPPVPDNIQIIRVVARPIIEVSIAGTWTPVHSSYWS